MVVFLLGARALLYWIISTGPLSSERRTGRSGKLIAQSSSFRWADRLEELQMRGKGRGTGPIKPMGKDRVKSFGS